MSKALVAFFSAEGTTKRVAQAVAETSGADIFEIVPVEPYTAKDIKWTNPMARCNREKIGKKDVPVAGSVDNMDEYDFIFLGFPIWYGEAPNVVHTFLKGYDLTGKKIALFATSGGTSIDKSPQKIQPDAKGAEIVDAKLFHSADRGSVEEWVKGLL